MGEGLLEARGGTRMEDVGEEYFKILTSRSFFQPSDHVSAFPLPDDKSCFIMHDCVHDLATFVLGDFGFQLEKNNLHRLPSKTRHLSIMREMIHDLEEISNAKCLHTFLALGSSAYISFMAMPLKLLMEEGCLRVLSLRHSGIAELPDSIGNLKHLRYLDLSATFIKKIPDTICTLYNLETLLLKGCEELTRLPTDIGNLKHLRYLDVSSTSIKEIPDTICTLYNLETLLLKHCRMLTGLPTDIVRLIKLRHLDFSGFSINLPRHIFYMDPGCILGKEHAGLRIRGLENVVDVKKVCEAELIYKFFMTDLGLCWVDDTEDSMKEREILDQLQPHTNLKKCCILCHSGTRLSDWMGDQSFSSIVQVDLIRCNCRSLWPLDQLPSLMTLKIEESFRRVETISREFFSNSSSMTKPFRSLQVLHFQSIAGWKELSFGEGEVVFPTLKELVLNDCPKLEVRLLPDCFPSLTRLEVISCGQVMLIPATHQGSIFPSLQELVIRHCPEQELFGEGEVVFPTLKELVLNGCPKLEARLLPDCFPSLTSLEVDYCSQVMLIPVTHQGSIFPSLLKLKIDGCEEQELFGEGEVVFPTLKELVLKYCPKLEVRLLPYCFPSLTSLEVYNCSQVMLIPATHQGSIFPSLLNLVIKTCPEQELILEGGLPSSLETIKISRCYNLKALDNNGFRLLTSLRKLEIEYCCELQCLPELPSYPFDLEIRMCSLLYSRCQENGEDWLKIKHARLQFI